MTLRLAARILGLLLALALLGAGILVAVGVTVDAERWRAPLAAAASRALAREVRLDGPTRLTVSLRPELAATGIRIANPPGFDAPEFARIGELRVAVELLPLVRGELRVREVLGREVTVRLARGGDGRGNWVFGAAPAAGSSEARRLEVDVFRIVLADLRVAHADRAFELARLEVEARAGQPTPWSVRATAKPPAKGVIAAGLRLSPGEIALDAIDGTIGATRISGALGFGMAGDRPNVTGRLAVPELDFAALPGHVSGDAAHGGFDLEWLGALDADLALEVGRGLGLPVEARDLTAKLRIAAGRATVPFQATLAGARFDGELAADATITPPRLRARLSGREVPLGELARHVLQVPYVAGTARRFEATLDARGRTGAELVRGLEARVLMGDARLTYGNYAGAKPVALELAAAEIAQPRGGAIAGKVRGSLRDKEFDATFRAGTIERVLRERRTPFGFDAASGDVRAHLSGTLAEPTDRTGPDIAFDVAAPRAGELAAWLGFAPESDVPVALKGTVQIRRGRTSLVDGSLLAGRTAVAGHATWETVDDRARVMANLVAELLAPTELRTLAPTTGSRATVFELPILPESLDFADTDLELRVKKIDGLPLEIADVVVQGRMRGGEITPSPVSLRLERNSLAGALALDARGAVPTASLWLAGTDFDLGALLRRLRVTRDVEARFGLLRLYADLRERRLGDLLEQSSFVANVESGTLELRDSNTGTRLRAAVAAGEIRAAAGGPVTAAVTGTAGTTPVTLKAQAAPLREFFAPTTPLPFALTAEAPAAKLAISGTAAPQRNRDVALALVLTGERLSGLDELLETSLPPWGPYALTGRVRLAQRGYDFDALRLALGQSVLEGKGALDTAAARPRLDLSLAAERIQLDDFPLAGWSPFAPPAARGEPLTVDAARRAVAGGARSVHALFSRERLERGDGRLEVAVKQVLSGRDELGRGRLAVTVADGHATIAPLVLETGAGRAWLALFYQPRARDVLVDARAVVDRFEYGALARRLRPGTDLSGTLSADLRLTARPPQLAGALANGSGSLDIVAWPGHLSAGGFDLWSANMVLRLLPFIDQRASLVNCLVGHFDLEQGTLRSEVLTMDTANTRTEGGARIDLARDTVHIRLVPRPKVPQFFSLATPIEITGTVDDFRISVQPADTLASAARWASSPALVPLQRITLERLPADGRDVCGAPRR